MELSSSATGLLMLHSQPKLRVMNMLLERNTKTIPKHAKPKPNRTCTYIQIGVSFCILFTTDSAYFLAPQRLPSPAHATHIDCVVSRIHSDIVAYVITIYWCILHAWSFRNMLHELTSQKPERNALSSCSTAFSSLNCDTSLIYSS